MRDSSNLVLCEVIREKTRNVPFDISEIISRKPNNGDKTIYLFIYAIIYPSVSAIQSAGTRLDSPSLTLIVTQNERIWRGFAKMTRILPVEPRARSASLNVYQPGVFP